MANIFIFLSYFDQYIECFHYIVYNALNLINLQIIILRCSAFFYSLMILLMILYFHLMNVFLACFFILIRNP